MATQNDIKDSNEEESNSREPEDIAGEQPQLVADVFNLGYIVTEATVSIYDKLLTKFGQKIAKKYLKDASQGDANNFVEKLRQSQVDKLRDRLTLLMNRVLSDNHFLKLSDSFLGDELKQANKIADNHLQSLENERSNLQRETDLSLEKIEDQCQRLMEHLITIIK